LSPRRPAALAASGLIALVAAGCGGGKEESTPPSPARSATSFAGIVSEDAFAHGSRYRSRTLDRERAAGVRLIRQPIHWDHVERSPGRYDFSRLDADLAAVSRRRIEFLPILFGSPPFRSSGPARGARRGTYPPRDPADMGAFGAALAQRYGPDGSFWRRHPDLPRTPIRAWQVWNEPNVPVYWPSGPDPAAYSRLLEETASAIKRVDPRAEIVSAGLTNSRLGVPLVEYATKMFEAGAGRALDTFALHAYARDDGGMLQAVADTRRLLERLGSSAPIWITEYGWASGGPRSPFTVGERAQAQRITSAMRGFAARRRELGIRGAVYYDWKDLARNPGGGGDFFGLHTGLVRLDGSPKPALGAFRRATRSVR
jgi:polysaccharide biosynthesis protein PslG